jgi:hypothetical protein
MTAKQDAGKALRSYRDEVRARIKQAEQTIEELRSEETRVERMIALHTGAADGNGAAPGTTAAAPTPTRRRRRRRRAQSANGGNTTTGAATSSAPKSGAAATKTSAVKSPTAKKTATRVPREQRRAQVVSALSNGPLGTRALAEKVGITTSAARDLAHDLRGEGVIVTRRDGQGLTAPEVHSLASSTPAATRGTATKTGTVRRRKSGTAKKSTSKKSASKKRGASRKKSARRR